MLAVLLENDQHSREVLISMLRDLGFVNVRATARVDEFIYFLQHERRPIDLIISTQQMENERDFSVAEFVSKYPHLDRCPILGLTERWQDEDFSPFKVSSRQSRVDSLITKPFLKVALTHKISEAFEHRASLRNKLVFYGSDASALQIEEEILANRDLQWKVITHFKNPQEMCKFLSTNPNNVGAIVIEPDDRASALAASIRRFKRSRVGSQTQFGVYGQYPKLLTPFIGSLNISFTVENSWEMILTALSARSLLAWRMNRRIHTIRRELKNENIKSAKRLLNESMRWDEGRWELLELSGIIHQDSKQIWKALQTQPCSPLAYLSLLKIVSEKDRAAILEQSKLYCPRHPGLVALRS